MGYDIYCLFNKINGKRYFGQTCCGVGRRWDQHRQNASSGSTKCPRLYASMRKYGSENFECLPWDEAETKEKADTLERFWIAEYETTDRDKGYNQMLGGEGGFLHSDETKKKMRNTALGRSESEETKKKVSLSHKEKNRRFLETVSVQEIVSLHKEGKTPQELCKHYGVPLNLVGMKLREGGVQIATIGHAKSRADRLISEGKEHLVNPDNMELRNLYESGKSIMEIGVMYEMGFQTVFNRLEKSGTSMRRIKFLDPSSPTKTCPKCQTTKDKECFSISNSSRDKRASWCKQCANRRGREKAAELRAKKETDPASCSENEQTSGPSISLRDEGPSSLSQYTASESVV